MRISPSHMVILPCLYAVCDSFDFVGDIVDGYFPELVNTASGAVLENATEAALPFLVWRVGFLYLLPWFATTLQWLCAATLKWHAVLVDAGSVFVRAIERAAIDSLREKLESLLQWINTNPDSDDDR